MNTPTDLPAYIDLKVILLVEDNEDHSDWVKQMIEEHEAGAQVHVVDSGRAALDYLFGIGIYANREEHPLPRFLLLDIGLPDFPGHQILETLKTGAEARAQDLHLIPVVILSSSDTREDKRKAYEKHANSYLTKPFDTAQWKTLLESTAHYWSQLNRRIG